MRSRSCRRLPFEILFEDDDIIVINKPEGLLTTHTKVWGRVARETQMTAENLLNDYVRKGQAKSRRRVWLVHRLDRETSGVLMFAKSGQVAEFFRSDWNRLTEKTYLARVAGILEEPAGVFESYLQEDADGYKVRSVQTPVHAARASGSSRPARLAKTAWRRLSTDRGTTLVEVKLHTGRKNQIRVHFAEAGHPVVGDVKYGGARAARMYLHACALRLRLPRYPDPFVAPCPFASYPFE
ncbi:MAG: RluA family pseudouridine synthase [Kiritimatiellia bacterium]